MHTATEIQKYIREIQHRSEPPSREQYHDELTKIHVALEFVRKQEERTRELEEELVEATERSLSLENDCLDLRENLQAVGNWAIELSST